MKTTITLIILAAAALVTSSCSTVNGIGKDVQRAGSGISNAAR
jgi:predicted small secreted protein